MIFSWKEYVTKASQQVKYIDSELSGESIVTSLVQKVNCRSKFLCREERFLDQKSKFSLCTALILCHLDYLCSSWYSWLSKAMKSKEHICQNKGIRFILDLSPMHSIDYSISYSIDMLNVDGRVRQMRLNHVFNIVHFLQV
jgi:hypothetical protein